MDFAHGVTLWRDLGMTGSGEPIPFQALVAIHWVHRKMAYLVLALLALLASRAWRIDGLRGPARLLAALLVLQALTGLSNVVLQWPLALAVLHNGGAAALAVTLLAFNFRLRGTGEPAPAQGHSPHAAMPAR
jgi:cytochrome c oxidase assembly protein subunit 15